MTPATLLRRYMIEAAVRKQYLYHFTDADNLPDIFQNGVMPLSYWGKMGIAMWYRSNLHRGDRPVILRVPFASFDPNYLEPDMRGLQDPPPSYVLDMIGGDAQTADEVSDAWDTTENPTWEDCLNLIGSVSYRGIVRVTKRNIFNAHH